MRAARGIPDSAHRALLEEFIDRYEGAVELTQVYPGVRSALAALTEAGHPLAICTNKPEAPARSVLAHFGLLDRFAAVVGGDSLPVRKPSPGHLLGVLAMMNAGPERAAMIGDSPADVATALNAGVPVIAVAYGYRRVPANDLGADVLIENFSDISAALTRLGL